ncbi:MAG: hypothetical protein JJ920_07325 [Roseitalea sp.]|jgi:hypothetical protein|nr:hypothetical protein [Roseitalea sp.]MBO6720345.1 hypothetical protein [Roseitalea sp.]MBO6742705.1 hypothetical protein [Roseitalea sp.]
MREEPAIPRLTPLQLPLRDALRGVATLAEVTEDLLEPAAALLPGAIRDGFRSAVHAIEGAGKRLMTAPITLDSVRTASGVLSQGAGDRDALATSAIVIAYAWEHLRDAGHEHHLMISETMLAGHMGSGAALVGATATERAASLVVDIRGSAVIGRPPGVPAMGGDEDRAAIDAGLVTIMVWLLAIRAETMEEEEKLLDLAFALVTAMQHETRTAMADPEKLSGHMTSLAAHL